MLVANALQDVFQDLNFVGLPRQGARADADFALPAGRYFMVMDLDRDLGRWR